MASFSASKRSAADIIFVQLRDEIMSLDLLPGTRLSEAEVAARFGVSRQPVREALNLLAKERLLEIRPQRASRVRLFSLSEIADARFARRALEIEVAKIAIEKWSHVHLPGFERCLKAQERALADQDTRAFKSFDEDFHRMIADCAEAPRIFGMILRHKAHVDRICILSFREPEEMAEVLEDHRTMLACLADRDGDGLETALRRHLSRIDRSISAVHAAHPDYFAS